ncbi:MAG TPA: tetratricopeptide repeat protein, partial [Trueperaceae bacterium]
SIRAVFERSWELLDNSEREAVRRLAVFHASFTTDAAAAVTGTPLAVLAELADKSLLQRPSPDRFEQHPLIHQYSREKLEAERNLEQQMKDRHAVYFLDLLDRLAPIIRTARQRDALMAIDADLENIRAAWHWRTSQGAGEALGKAGGVLRVFFDQVGRAREGSQWFAAATSRLAGQSEHRAALGRLLVHQAWLTLQSGDMKGATKLVKSGMAFLKSAGDMRGLYWAANALGAAAATGGNFGAAKKQFETSLALAEHLKDGNLQSISLDNLGNVEQALGNEDVALRHYRKALELARRDNSTPQIIAVLNNLGSLFLATREPASARPLLEEGYDLARQVGIHRLIPYYLANLGQAYFLLGETKAAAKAYRDAILAARNANQLWLESALLADLARVATASRHTQHARAHVDRSLKLAFGLQDPPLILHAAACMSELLHSQGRKAEAAQLAEVVLLHPGARWEDKALAGGLVPGSPDPRGDAPEAVDWLERIQSAQAAL